uniref:Solute carrier family 15 member 2 n=1 Tax=Oncorhynchus tshawytscha TaxID=74940 RepID=A0A8C8BRU3_ONCTS
MILIIHLIFGYCLHSKLCGTNYPVCISFIVVNEFCERFSYYGMKAVLTLYFINYLHWNQNLSTAVYHAFSSLCYFTPILGALIADSWLGKFKTIVYLSVVYVLGHVVKSVGAIPSVGDSTIHIALSMMGLILIAFGTGGIKPCVAAFGGDQFDEEHTNERRKFFSIFYMSINAGSLLSTVITPILRGNVQCFGGDCYALAFGVPAILMVIALVVFISGSGMYKKSPPEGNVLLDVCRCLGLAIKNRWMSSKYDSKRKHWLDWAEEKYPKRLIHEIKMVLRVLVLFIPLPMFWALFDQQGSRWTLQATRMNMAFMLNALLILMFVPIFDVVIISQYPQISFTSALSKSFTYAISHRYTSVRCTSGSQDFSINLGLLDSGASYTVILKGVSHPTANNVHIAWQIPQYALMTAGEVMFSIPGIEFSYSQAPANMKSLLQAGWLLTVAFGNVIVLIVAEGAGLDQWMEFLLFAGLLVAVCIIFSIMAYFYTYVDLGELDKLFPDKTTFIKRSTPGNHFTLILLLWYVNKNV